MSPIPHKLPTLFIQNEIMMQLQILGNITRGLKYVHVTWKKKYRLVSICFIYHIPIGWGEIRLSEGEVQESIIRWSIQVRPGPVLFMFVLISQILLFHCPYQIQCKTPYWKHFLKSTNRYDQDNPEEVGLVGFPKMQNGKLFFQGSWLSKNREYIV